jgi:DNA-binding response OmpR family regulator
MTTILVVEDETKISAVVADYLQHAGFQVTIAADGATALERARSLAPDLVVLDLGLPDVDGVDVARELRRRSRVPIIMLTARADELDRILGLELGADDYVTKPFSPRELVARVRAVLRRGEPDDVQPAFTVGDVTIDPAKMRVTVAGRRVELTATEFTLVARLAREPGRVFGRGQLLEAIHGTAGDGYERAVDAHVKNLRRKLEPDPRQPTHVLTVHGVGYRFAEPPVTTAARGPARSAP